jgi:glycosyltransferase involved in cell wall biosynthesis
MKILNTVEFYYPHVGGMEEVVRQLSEELTSLGHQVTIATTKLPGRKSHNLNGVKIAEFDISGKYATGIFGEKQKYLDFVLNSKFDVITNFAAQEWATDLLLPILDKIKARKVFVPTGFSGLYSPFYKNYFTKMKTWMKKYDANVFLSNNYRDINFARKNNIKGIKLIPNGASEKEFLGNNKIKIRQILGIPNDNFLILSVGSHTGMKGHTETIKIFKQAKIANCTLLIIGKPSGVTAGCSLKCRLLRLFSGSNKKNILIKDLERSETVAAFKSADLFLFTSRIECSPLVLFEAMAAKTPFLTTDVGNAEEIIKWSRSGILLPTEINNKGYSRAKVSGSAVILRRLFENPDRRKLMAKRGFKAWKKKFTWKKIAGDYESLYKSLIKRSS